MPDPEFSVDELMAVCISRQIRDGEIVAQGLATPLVVAGFLLAKCTHAPNLRFASAIGQGVCQNWSPLGVARTEELLLGPTLWSVGFLHSAPDVLAPLPPNDLFPPSQV